MKKINKTLLQIMVLGLPIGVLIRLAQSLWVKSLFWKGCVVGAIVMFSSLVIITLSFLAIYAFRMEYLKYKAKEEARKNKFRIK